MSSSGDSKAEQSRNLSDILGFDPDMSERRVYDPKSFAERTVVSGKDFRGLLEGLRTSADNTSALLSLNALTALNEYSSSSAFPDLDSFELKPYIRYSYNGERLNGREYKEWEDKDPQLVTEKDMDGSLDKFKAVKDGDTLVLVVDEKNKLSDNEAVSLAKEIGWTANMTKSLLGKKDKPRVVLVVEGEYPVLDEEIQGSDETFIRFTVEDLKKIDPADFKPLAKKVAFSLFAEDSILQGTHRERVNVTDAGDERIILGNSRIIKEAIERGDKPSTLYTEVLHRALVRAFRSPTIQFIGRLFGEPATPAAIERRLISLKYDVSNFPFLKASLFSSLNPKIAREAFYENVGIRVIGESPMKFSQLSKKTEINAELSTMEDIVIQATYHAEDVYSSFFGFLAANYVDLRELGSGVEGVSVLDWTIESLCKRLGIDYAQAMREWKES